MKRIARTLALGCLLVAFGAVSQAAELYGITGHGGTPRATLHVLSQTDASTTPVLALGDNGGGQAIAFNPDDGFMYHWAGYPAGNALYERVDLATNSVTDIPLSGFSTIEISSATYDWVGGVFLTNDLWFNFGTVTTDGFRVYLGNTSSWVKGLAFVGDTLYGGRNMTDYLTGEAHLFTIDPATGATLATTVVTMPGHDIYGFNGLATHPETGQLWALIRRSGLPRKARMLATIDPSTGVPTEIGILPEGSGFASIAFVPDPVILVEIDIKPGSDLNPINPGSSGVIPVAIFSTEDFDATTVDPTTVELAGAKVAVRGKGKNMAHEEDVNEDGLVDLVCQVETESLAEDIDCGEVRLTGETYGGEQIEGYDIILVVPTGE